MDTRAYPAEKTAVLVMDPYNDFMTEGGKFYGWIKDVALSVDMFGNLRKILKTVRAAGMQVFIVPHHRSHEGDYDHWEHMNPSQVTTHKTEAFAVGTWGGEWNAEFGPKEGDVIIQEHWSSSGFANTDLDEQLKQHGIQKIIIIGMIANSCVEATGRYGMEYGYHVTLVRDATSAFSEEAMRVTMDLNAPMFAHAVVTTAELLAQLPHRGTEALAVGAAA